jgi:hypothetical protein
MESNKKYVFKNVYKYSNGNQKVSVLCHKLLRINPEHRPASVCALKYWRASAGCTKRASPSSVITPNENRVSLSKLHNSA